MLEAYTRLPHAQHATVQHSYYCVAHTLYEDLVHMQDLTLLATCRRACMHTVQCSQLQRLQLRYCTVQLHS